MLREVGIDLHERRKISARRLDGMDVARSGQFPRMLQFFNDIALQRFRRIHEQIVHRLPISLAAREVWELHPQSLGIIVHECRIYKPHCNRLPFTIILTRVHMFVKKMLLLLSILPQLIPS